MLCHNNIFGGASSQTRSQSSLTHLPAHFQHATAPRSMLRGFSHPNQPLAAKHCVVPAAAAEGGNAPAQPAERGMHSIIQDPEPGKVRTDVRPGLGVTHWAHEQEPQQTKKGLAHVPNFSLTVSSSNTGRTPVCLNMPAIRLSVRK
jgi:hypothetical protein